MNFTLFTRDPHLWIRGVSWNEVVKISFRHAKMESMRTLNIVAVRKGNRANRTANNFIGRPYSGTVLSIWICTMREVWKKGNVVWAFGRFDGWKLSFLFSSLLFVRFAFSLSCDRQRRRRRRRRRNADTMRIRCDTMWYDVIRYDTIHRRNGRRTKDSRSIERQTVAHTHTCRCPWASPCSIINLSHDFKVFQKLLFLPSLPMHPAEGTLTMCTRGYVYLYQILQNAVRKAFEVSVPSRRVCWRERQHSEAQWIIWNDNILHNTHSTYVREGQASGACPLIPLPLFLGLSCVCAAWLAHRGKDV